MQETRPRFTTTRARCHRCDQGGPRKVLAAFPRRDPTARARHSWQVGAAGYVGHTTAGCAPHLGNEVRCADVQPERIARLCDPNIPEVEERVSELVPEGLASEAVLSIRKPSTWVRPATPSRGSHWPRRRQQGRHPISTPQRAEPARTCPFEAWRPTSRPSLRARPRPSSEAVKPAVVRFISGRDPGTGARSLASVDPRQLTSSQAIGADRPGKGPRAKGCRTGSTRGAVAWSRDRAARARTESCARE